MNLQELKSRLSIFFNQDESRVEMYLDRFGAELNMKNIKIIRDLKLDQTSETEEAGKTPTYKIKAQCPVCKNTEIEIYELLAKSQIVQYDPFMMPIFRGAGDYRSVDYPKWAVTICQKCYFASPDKKDFNIWNRSREEYNPSQLGNGVILQVLETMGERKSIVEEFSVHGNPFTFPRSTESAINSYRLALQRTQAEQAVENSFSTFKAASYWLKIALMQRQSDDNYEESLQNARAAMREAYIRTDFPHSELEYQSTYVLSALELFFGEGKLCREYHASLDRTKAEIKNEQIEGNLNSLDKWIDKCRRLWEDREREGLWDLPKIKEQ